MAWLALARWIGLRRVLRRELSPAVCRRRFPSKGRRKPDMRWRRKTDAIDAEGLLRALMAWARGERRVCSMVRPPSPEEEDRHRLCREREALVTERIRHTNRICSPVRAFLTSTRCGRSTASVWMR